MSSPEDTRTRILEAARTLLEQRGYRVGLEEIASAAGVSRQAVYLHFGSRGRLLVALVHHIDKTGDLPKRLARVAKSPNALTALDRMAETVSAYDPQILKIAMVFFDARRSDPEFEAAWRDRMESRRIGFGRVVEWLRRDGVLAPGWTIADATDAMSAIASIPAADQLVGSRGWSQKRYARYLKTVLRRTFTTAG
jgi:AcrR family transcriptional regulator